MAIPIKEAIIRRKNGRDVCCLYGGMGITDNDGHPETEVCPTQWNSHGNKYRS